MFSSVFSDQLFLFPYFFILFAPIRDHFLHHFLSGDRNDATKSPKFHSRDRYAQFSLDMDIEEIPIAQEKIINHGKKTKKPVYVATNLLETMVKESQPTRAESHDIFSTLKEGASGLVLAAETAIGINPIGCVDFLKKSIRIYKKFKKKNKKSD